MYFGIANEIKIKIKIKNNNKKKGTDKEVLNGHTAGFRPWTPVRTALQNAITLSGRGEKRLSTHLREEGSLYVSGKLFTYPSPKPTYFCPK